MTRIATQRLFLGRLIATFCGAVLLALGGCSALPPSSTRFDETPRVAVISAFQPELTLLREELQQSRSFFANGVEFNVGVLRGKPVVMFLSGVSMTNAAMNTQLVLDRFRITHLVFSGIAGGVNPQLHIGDVTVAQRWGQYLEILMARETAPGQYMPPPWITDANLPNYGAMYPRPVEVRSALRSGGERKFWFDADPALLDIASRIKDVELDKCDAANLCLSHAPRLVLGGSGVSGQAFVDNAAFREYTFRTFRANVLDMETAATAMVAYSNGVPFIAFRSLSDLAGGGEGANEIGTFMKLAADNSAKVLLAFLAAWK
ncbi:MAG: 5'-methylthioadenosine/S-adenosylhomocysteine nucleosidase [Variovorax sp.]